MKSQEPAGSSDAVALEGITVAFNGLLSIGYTFKPDADPATQFLEVAGKDLRIATVEAGGTTIYLDWSRSHKIRNELLASSSWFGKVGPKSAVRAKVRGRMVFKPLKELAYQVRPAGVTDDTPVPVVMVESIRIQFLGSDGKPRGEARKVVAAEDVKLPELDGKSVGGLKIECRLAQPRFVVGEPVNVWCTVTNTTDSIKPIGWHSNTGEHFCLVEHGKATREGVLPRAYPQLRSPIMVKSKPMRPSYILFLPPQESIVVLLTHKAERPVKFKGRIVYDPVAPRGGWVVTNDEQEGPPWKDEWVSSNEFEYEVIEGGK